VVAEVPDLTAEHGLVSCRCEPADAGLERAAGADGEASLLRRAVPGAAKVFTEVPDRTADEVLILVGGGGGA